MRLKAYAGKTHKGPFLEVNEDSFDVDLSQELFMVVDAFGGAGHGDQCAKTITANMKKVYSHMSGDPDSTHPFFYAPQYLIEGNALINAAISSHQLILDENKKKEITKRSGASGVFLSLSENVANILSIGNCQTYYYSLGKVTKVYEPDSLSVSGPYTQRGPRIPFNAFGLYDYLHFNFKELRANEGDALIMLTDGVYNRLDGDEIRVMVEKNTQNLNGAISQMFALANKRNNFDNQSCIILSF